MRCKKYISLIDQNTGTFHLTINKNTPYATELGLPPKSKMIALIYIISKNPEEKQPMNY